jgi:hypothetical protein
MARAKPEPLPVLRLFTKGSLRGIGKPYSAIYARHAGLPVKGRRDCLFRACFFLLPLIAHAADAPYLIPQIVFVGDRASLIVPLGSADTNVQPKTIDLPETPDDVVLHNITLEQRKGGAMQLVIEFTAYRPGDIAFPVIRVPGLSDVTGLKTTIASLLEPSSMTLSAPAAPLLAPGTASLIYGSVTVIILFLIFGIGMRLFWTNRFINVRKNLLRRYLLIHIKLCIAKLRKQAEKHDGADGAVLDLLSAEFRRFLTRFTGIDCLAMSAAEFAGLDHGIPLSVMFRRWDTFRFNVERASHADITGALDDAYAYVNDLKATAHGEKREEVRGV